MFSESRNRIHRHAGLIHTTVEGALLNASVLLVTLLTLLILFLGIYFRLI